MRNGDYLGLRCVVMLMVWCVIAVIVSAVNPSTHPTAFDKLSRAVVQYTR